ncbi:MAG: DUF3858 domain-containing protein, partial [Candidatus Omnitrophica bacterium]|nr:DUF3858 domain-containing protein [Candidatus Omnitrophota bacterium]
DDQARRVLVIKDEGYQIDNIPLSEAEHNLIKQELKIKVNPEEAITATETVIAYGTYNQAQRAWLWYTPPQLIQDTLKERIQQDCIGASLEQYQVQNLDNLNLPVVLRYSFKGPEYFIPAGNLRIFPQLVSWDSSVVAKERRRYDIDFGYLYTQKVYYEIEIPAGFLIKYIPDNLTEDNPWFKFNVEYNYHDRKIYLVQSMQLKKDRVLKEEYPNFKPCFENLAKKVKQRIILQKIK